MKLFTIALFMLAASATNAKADGFNCASDNDDVHAKVYNHIDPSAGTRTPAVLIISDPQDGAEKNHTIAHFTDVDGTLTSHGARYVATVSDELRASAKGDSLISGTRLADVATMTLNVVYAFNHPLPNGAETSGYLVLSKTDGTTTAMELVCKRYLRK